MNASREYGIRELANYVLDLSAAQNISLTNMSLNKLVYFAYEHALLQYNRKLTSAKIEAWEHGPVFREIYRSFSSYGNRPISNRAVKYNAITDKVEEIKPALSLDDQNIIIEAISELMSLSASVLREISHSSDGPWAATWHHEDPANPGMQISDDLIKQSYQRSRTQ